MSAQLIATTAELIQARDELAAIRGELDEAKRLLAKVDSAAWGAFITDLAEAREDSARLDWLLNITRPHIAHKGNWPYPDIRGTWGPRWVGITYYEDCEGRPQGNYFNDRAAIDAAMEGGK